LAANSSAHAHAASLLLLAYWYPPENESGAMRPARFCKYLPAHGYRPIVLSAPLSEGVRGNPDEAMRTPSGPAEQRWPAWQIRLGRGLQRAAPYHDHLDWAAEAVRLGGQIVPREKVVALVSTSPPLATHVAALILHRRSGLPWIADFRDPIVGNPFRTKRRGWLYDRLLESRIVASANAVVLNTDAMLDVFRRRYPRHAAKFHVIWNGYDPADRLSAGAIPSRKRRVLAHLGSIYGGRHPGLLLSSLERLLRRGEVDPESLVLKLVGSIDHDEDWATAPCYSFLEAHHCLETTNGTVPRDEARREMATADYLLLLDLNERGQGVQVPAKLFEYVRIGRPILVFTTSGSPTERILARAGVPHVCVFPDEREHEIDRKVRGFLQLPSDAAQSSDWFRSQFDAEAQTAVLADLIDSTRGRARA
jgi:glycosyltransferase involved in cell wall biosynthesis